MSLSVPLLLSADRWGHRDHGAGLGPIAFQLTSRMQPAVKPVLVNLTCPCCKCALATACAGQDVSHWRYATHVHRSELICDSDTRPRCEGGLACSADNMPLARHRTNLTVHSNVLCYPKVCVCALLFVSVPWLASFSMTTNPSPPPLCALVSPRFLFPPL